MNAPDPTGPDDDRVVYSLTKAGREAGFDLGQPYRVDVEDGRLTIEAAAN